MEQSYLIFSNKSHTNRNLIHNVFKYNLKHMLELPEDTRLPFFIKFFSAYLEPFVHQIYTGFLHQGKPCITTAPNYSEEVLDCITKSNIYLYFSDIKCLKLNFLASEAILLCRYCYDHSLYHSLVISVPVHAQYGH